MLTIPLIVTQIKSEDWYVMIDLKDDLLPYFILPQYRKFPRFAFGDEPHQYRVLPFGLLSPHTFTKCMDSALAPLRLQGMLILNYIDNLLILAQSQEMVARHQDAAVARIKLGQLITVKQFQS